MGGQNSWDGTRRDGREVGGKLLQGGELELDLGLGLGMGWDWLQD